MKRLRDLTRWFEGRRGALVALSGGVDSALVAYAAFSRLGDSAIAVTADYRTLSQEELGAAKSVCSEIGIRHVMLQYDELENPDFVRNDSLRCYHCRSELGGRIAKLAEEMEGHWDVMDGTNLDDLGDYRPGIEAMRKNRVQSPLVETGFTKDDVRAVARDVGLSVHDRPSNSCLASRIPWGERITAERLARVELGERIVRQMSGARQVRVRDVGGSARIEVEPEALYVFDDGDDRVRDGNCGATHQDNPDSGSRLDARRGVADGRAADAADPARGLRGRRLMQAITERLVLIGFDGAALDPEGYRPGKINDVVTH